MNSSNHPTNVPTADTPFHLQGRTVLVTGASSGIGLACAVQIAAMGGIVIATGRNEERLQALLKELPGSGHRVMVADLTRSEDLSTLTRSLPALDGVVNAAGIVTQLPLKFLTQEKIRELLAINYEAPILLVQKLLHARLINRAASIVNIASTAGLFGARTLAAYAGTKGALIASTKVMALELAPLRARANAVAPAMVRTPLAEQVTDTVSEESMREHEKTYPLGFGEPNDVANAVTYLLSPAAKWITGTTLVLDGGYTCQ